MTPESAGDRPEIYNEFLEIMKSFKSQEIDTPGVIERVSTLFKGYGKLIYGFNTFLPEGYKIDVPIELREQLRGEIVHRPPHHRMHDESGPPSSNAYGAGGAGGMPGGKLSSFFVPRRMSFLSTAKCAGFVGGGGKGPMRNVPGGGAGGGKKGPMNMVGGGGQMKPQQRYDDDDDAGGRQPPEFDNAIAYVTAIKKRFAREPETYKAFLEVLHTYQREQKGIQDVLRRVAELFKDHADLLREFTYFLPDAAIEPAQRLFLKRAADDADQRTRQARRDVEMRQGPSGNKKDMMRGGPPGRRGAGPGQRGGQNQSRKRGQQPIGSTRPLSKSMPSNASRPTKKRGASLASLRTSAATARASAREVIKRQEKEAAIENAPRIEEMAVLKRLRFALLGDEGAIHFPPDDPRKPWKRPGRRARLSGHPADLPSRKVLVAAEKTDDSKLATISEEDQEDKNSKEEANPKNDDEEEENECSRVLIVKQPPIRQTPLMRERHAAWRDVLKVLDAVSRGALKGEAISTLLREALADAVDWGGRDASSGTPSGDVLADDISALATKASRLAPTIECVSQSLALARRAMTPGSDPDPSIMRGDLERAQAYARFQAGSRRTSTVVFEADDDMLDNSGAAAALLASKSGVSGMSDTKKSSTSTRANTRRQRGGTVGTRASSPVPMDGDDRGSPSDDDIDEYESMSLASGRASRSAAKSPPRAVAVPKGGAGLDSGALSKLLASSRKFPGDWTSLPLSELDFLDDDDSDDDDLYKTQQRTPSYRRLPDSVPRAVCSHRSETDASVLNDDLVSVANTSDDANYSQLQLRRNAHEEALFKAEDEHFEIDMVVNANSAAIRALEAIVRHGGANPVFVDTATEYDDYDAYYEEDGEDEDATPMDEDGDSPTQPKRSPRRKQLAMKEANERKRLSIGGDDDDTGAPGSKRLKGATSPTLSGCGDYYEALVAGPQKMERRCLSPIHLAAICRVYGDRDVEALKALEKSPAVAAKVIAKRLREKDLEWRATRRGLARRWRRRCRTHFAKSLDHRAHFWRALDKKRCSTKWLVQEIKDINDDDDEGSADRPQSRQPWSTELKYDLSCAEIRRDAFKVLMLALESSSTPLAERRLVARSVWRDFAADLLTIPVQWLARHFPPSLSRADVETRFAELAARSGNAPDNSIDDDDSGLVLGSHAKQVGDELKIGSRVLTPYGLGIVSDRRPPDLAALVQQQESEQQRLLVEIDDELSASYDVRYAWGRGFIRPRDVFALDEPGTAVVDDPEDPFAAIQSPTVEESFEGEDPPTVNNGAKQQPAKRGRPPKVVEESASPEGGTRPVRASSIDSANSSRRTRRRTSTSSTKPSKTSAATISRGGGAQKDEDTAAAVMMGLRKSPAAVRGRVFADERLYVFARLYQMIYERLADARQLCARESRRKERQAQEPHEVIDAVAADEQGEPPAESESDEEPEESDGVVCSAGTNPQPPLAAGAPPSASPAPAAANKAAASNGASTANPTNNGKGVGIVPQLSLSPLYDFDEEIQRCCQKGYAGFLELVAMLLCGDVNKSTFDDACRELLGNDGYRVRAIDRLARATVDAMRALASDDAFKALRDVLGDDDDDDTSSPVAKRSSPRGVQEHTEYLSMDGTTHTFTSLSHIHAAARRELVASTPSLAGEDLYRVCVNRDSDGDPLSLTFKYIGASYFS